MPVSNYFTGPNERRSRNPRIFTRMYHAIKHLDYTQLYRKQDINNIESKMLAKVLTIVDLIAYGVSVTVGAGIFATTATALQEAGPALIFSYIITGITSFFSALCFGEFAARIPVSGSAYTFAYATMGEFVAWVIGVWLTLEYGLSSSVTAKAWALALEQGLLNFGVTLPFWLQENQLGIFTTSPLSVCIILFCTVILLIGAKESNRANICMMLFNMTILVFIVALGSIFFNSANLTPFAPKGLAGVLVGSSTVFFSYIGFDGVTTLAGEVKNPRRDLPLAIMAILTIVTLLYLGVSIVLTGMVPLDSLNLRSPLSEAFTYSGVPWAAKLIAIGAVTTLSATTLTSLMGQPRIFYQMAQDGLLFQSMMKTSRRQVPWISTLVTSIVSLILAFFLNLDELSKLITIGTLFVFAFVCSGVILLRYRKDEGSFENPIQKTTLSYGRFSKVETLAKILTPYLPTLLLLWGLLAITFAILMNLQVPIKYAIIPLIPEFFLFFVFLIFSPNPLPDTFVCPLVPLIPLIGIFTNLYMVVASYKSFAYFCAWTILGIIIYASYGIWNSKLRVIPSQLTNHVSMSNITVSSNVKETFSEK